MTTYPKDIYTEPNPDPNTLAMLGPLRALAGTWVGEQGQDVNPKADGPEHQAYVERMVVEPIDAQTNGPQLFYGLRYHTHITKPGGIQMFHDQVGYWLWEPATHMVYQTISIPRGQSAMAMAKVAPDARHFTLHAVRGEAVNGILSNAFLEHAFRTERISVAITVHDDDTWSYEQESVLVIPGQREPFLHTDRNTLRRVAQPTPNPMGLACGMKAP